MFQQLKILMLDMTIDHLEMDWFKDKLLLMKTMILIHIFSGGPARGRVDEGAGEVEGNHRGAGADLRRDVRILKAKLAQILVKLKRNRYMWRMMITPPNVVCIIHRCYFLTIFPFSTF